MDQFSLFKDLNDLESSYQAFTENAKHRDVTPALSNTISNLEQLNTGNPVSEDFFQLILIASLQYMSQSSDFNTSPLTLRWGKFYKNSRDMIINFNYTCKYLSNIDSIVEFRTAMLPFIRDENMLPSSDNKGPYSAYDRTDGKYSGKFIKKTTSKIPTGKRRFIATFNQFLQTQIILNQENRSGAKSYKGFTHVPFDRDLSILSKEVGIEEEEKDDRIKKKYLMDILHHLLIISNSWRPLPDATKCDQLAYYYALERIYHPNLILSFISSLKHFDHISNFYTSDDFYIQKACPSYVSPCRDDNQEDCPSYALPCLEAIARWPICFATPFECYNFYVGDVTADMLMELYRTAFLYLYDFSHCSISLASERVTQIIDLLPETFTYLPIADTDVYSDESGYNEEYGAADTFAPTPLKHVSLHCNINAQMQLLSSIYSIYQNNV